MGRTATRSAAGGRATPPQPTYGPVVAAWIEECLVHGEGDWLGQPFRLTGPQRRFLNRLFAHDRHGNLIVREALLGRAKGWGKTGFLAAVALALVASPIAPRSPNVVVAAASFEQADLLFGDARLMVTEGPLKPFLDVYDTEILVRGQPGAMRRVAAAAGTNDGGRPTGFIADELHEWTGNKERVHLVIGNSATKRHGLVLNITTAGADLDSLAGRKYLYGKQIEAGQIIDPGFLFDWLEAAPSWDLTDPAQLRAAVLEANEHAELFGTIESIVRRYHEIAEHEFRRYHLNQWVRAAGCWLPDGAWDACSAPELGLADGAPTWVGVDMALRHDNAGVVAVQKHGRRMPVRARVWKPDGLTIDVQAVEQHLRDLHRRYRLREVAYDPAYFARSAQVLEDEGLPMVAWPQGAARMVPACQTAYQLVCDRSVAHDNDPVLTDHVLSAQPRDVDGGWRLSKGKSRRPIDACIALVMAVAAAAAPAELAGVVATAPAAPDAGSIFRPRGRLNL